MSAFLLFGFFSAYLPMANVAIGPPGEGGSRILIFEISFCDRMGIWIPGGLDAGMCSWREERISEGSRSCAIGFAIERVASRGMICTLGG